MLISLSAHAQPRAGCAGQQSQWQPEHGDHQWEAFCCHDGLTGCVGFAGENERVLMLSYTVRAPPRLVIKVRAKTHFLALLLPCGAFWHAAEMQELATAP